MVRFKNVSKINQAFRLPSGFRDDEKKKVLAPAEILAVDKPEDVKFLRELCGVRMKRGSEKIGPLVEVKR